MKHRQISSSHYMVLPQTFLYRISTMQSFKSYNSLLGLKALDTFGSCQTSFLNNAKKKTLAWSQLILVITQNNCYHKNSFGNEQWRAVDIVRKRLPLK